MNETPADRRAAQKARHREAILDAADALIRERGKPQFSVEELAARADVSRRTVFNHFPSLDDVVITACSRVLSEVVDDFRAAASAHPQARATTAELFGDLAVALRTIDLPGVIAYLWGVLTAENGDSRTQHPLADIFTRVTDQLATELAGRSGIDQFEVGVLVSSLMGGISVAATQWIARTGASLDAASRAEWDALVERLINTIRTGYPNRLTQTE